MTTIRKNNLKAIRALLESAALISEYRYDDMDGSNNRAVTADEVMARAADFHSVNTQHVTIHQNFFFTVYPTVADAKRRMTDVAFARHFPQAMAA
jgi:hypothetical protein